MADRTALFLSLVISRGHSSKSFSFLSQLNFFIQTRTLAPSTPLTGRRYLKDRDQVNITPVSTATQSVSRLQGLLSGCKTAPSEALIKIFK